MTATTTASVTYCTTCQIDYGTRTGLVNHACPGQGKGRRW
jgi:hypothetical protein